MEVTPIMKPTNYCDYGFNPKTEKLFRTIVKSEDLSLRVYRQIDALGNLLIVAEGDPEEIEIFADVYRMVKR